MNISEKGLTKALTKAYTKGYEIAMSGGTSVNVYTEMWALETETRGLTLKSSQTLVEHYGGLLTVPAFVRKGQQPQMMMETEVQDRRNELGNASVGDDEVLHRIPITFKDKWVLFATSQGRVFAYDREILDVLDWATGSCDMRVSACGVGVFDGIFWRLSVAPGMFAAEDKVRLEKIAELYKEQRVVPEEEPENMCLFDDMDRE